VAAIVVPFRRDSGKTRLAPLPPEARAELADAMLADVLAACSAVAPTRVADGLLGQAAAVREALAGLDGPVAVVNADLPCARPDEIAALLAEAPALVAAEDGTTNALSLLDPAGFRPLYGPGSAARFEATGLRPLRLPGLVDDVDTLADLERVAARVGPSTRKALESLRVRA
jgi:2-phospho-L-lactate guanylyltransferase (CobY/MobA/RfbA family)